MTLTPAIQLACGYTMDTPQTRRWDRRTREANDFEEGRRLFVNQTEADQGRSRQLVAVCETPAQAQAIVALLSVVAAEEGRKYAPILEALKWYADENNYCDFAPGYFTPICDADGGGTEFTEDEGTKARSALAQWEAL